MEAKTFVTCGRCGIRKEFGEAISQGWLVASRRDGRGMVIRCSQHITAYALRQAGARR